MQTATRILLAMGLLASACTGTIDPGHEPGGTLGAGTGASRGNTDQPRMSPSSSSATNPSGTNIGGVTNLVMPLPGTPTPGSPNPAACKPTPGHSVRRLTRFEYVNTVRDLLGLTVDVSARLPDDVLEGSGFDNFPAVQNVTDLHADRYDQAARALAATAVQNLPALMGCDPVTTGEDACANQFLPRLARQAYRRPLEADEDAYLSTFYKAQKAKLGWKEAIEVAIAGILQSGSFLYRVELGAPGTPLTSHETAARLSYLFLGSLPDQALQAAAAADALKTPVQIRAQVDRLLADPRAAVTVGHLFEQWLDTARIAEVEKDPKVFPAFTRSLPALWRKETAAFLNATVLGSDSRLETLLGAPFTYANGALAKFYSLTGPAGDAFEKVALPAGKRVGLLSQASFVAVHAHSNQTSPVKRGVFVRRMLLCQTLPSPPDDADISVPDPKPGLTTRQRFESHTMQPACASCHLLIDRVGVGFENLDGIGRWRETEEQMPIDTRGELLGTDVDGGFNSLVEMTDKLAHSDQVRACVVRNMFEFSFGRSPTQADACTLDSLGKTFRGQGDFKLRDLLAGLAATPLFAERTTVAAP